MGNKHYYIYKTTNLVNGKIYIGQRWSNKLCGDDRYLGSGLHFKNSVKKYGRDNFKKEVVEYCSSPNELNEREIYWIDFYNSRNPKIGYNIAKGGDGGAIEGELNPMYGKFGELNPFYGKKHTQETKTIISNFRKELSVKKVECPFCKKFVTAVTANQYHFDNCKQNPNLSEESKKMWKNRHDLTKKARKDSLNDIIVCPHCNKSGIRLNMERYHFDNCLKAPVLSNYTKCRIDLKQKEKLIRKQKAKDKRDIGQKDMVCEWCGEKYKNSNFFKYHMDKCKYNPNYKPEIFKCKYCGIETVNKSNITRFHDENCKHKNK